MGPKVITIQVDGKPVGAIQYDRMIDGVPHVCFGDADGEKCLFAVPIVPRMAAEPPEPDEEGEAP